MEATLNLTQENSATVEISNFLNEGIQDMKNGKIVSFDEVFMN